MSAARDEILARIRACRQAAPAVDRSYRRGGALDGRERLELFCARVADYRADVRRTDAARLAEELASVCRTRHATRIGAPPALPPAWRPAGVDVVDDRSLTASELDALDGVVTACTVAIAETGTIALSGGPDEGRRALTLVPDLHICVVREEQIVELVPEAIEVLGELVDRERRPITLISGPSATSDIELSRVEGVHGPRSLVVLVVEQEPA